MPAHSVRVEGTVTDVFAHRFVVKTETGSVLADLTPKGAEKVALSAGDSVSIEGEQKPSEIKVLRLSRGGEDYEFDHPHGPGDEPHGIDLETAQRAATDAGYRLIGEPRRKPKHFEILGEKDGHYYELHAHRDGIRHEKPVAKGDPKWGAELKGAH